MNRFLRQTRRIKGGKRGFTILELLVATIVFSVVLLLVTAGIMQIARVYYKGVTETNTQNAARNIIETISQAIQFSGGPVTNTDTPPVPGAERFFCIGSQHYSYKLGWQVENNPVAGQNQSWHALVQQPLTGSCAGVQTLTNQAIVGRDLLGRHMRLSKLVVLGLGNNQYRVEVRVVFGDNDLLSNPTDPNTVCRGESAGTQFCSISELSTTVVKRVK